MNDPESKGDDRKRKSDSSEMNPREETRKALPLRILFISLRILFIWIPVFVISLVAIILLALKLYLSPARVEKLIVNNFNEMSYGDITLKVKDFSPYSGFEIHHIRIRNGEEFDRSVFVEIERLVFRYDFFAMLIGNVHFNEIGIYKPRIYLEERNGVWNAARLMKPGEKKPEEEVEEPEEEGPPTKEIRLPLSVEFLFDFILDDLQLFVQGSTFSSAVKGLSLNCDIWVPPFKTIPKSIEAVNILERMKIELNPQEEMDVSFYSRDAEVRPPLILTWKLNFNRVKEKPEFASHFKFGTYKTPVRFKRSHLAPLNFMISYNIFYHPIEDYVKLDHLGISFRGKKWLSLSGMVKEVTKKPDIYLRMTESEIVLDDLYPYFLSLTGDRKTKFAGTISLLPLTIQGNPDDIDIDGTISLKRILFRNPSAEANIPALSFWYSVLKRGENMKILSRIQLPHLFYSLRKDKSGDNGLSLELDVSAYNSFQQVEINALKFNCFNPSQKRSVLNLAMNGNVYLKPSLKGNVRISQFRFVRDPLITMLPKGFRKAVSGIPLKKPLDMNLSLAFAMGKAIIDAVLNMQIRVPDYDLNDLKLGVSVVQDNARKRITLRRFSLGSRSKGLAIATEGVVDLKKPPVSDMDLKLTVSLNSPALKTVYHPWKARGSFKLNAAVKGDLKDGRAFGSIKIDKFLVRNDESKLSVEDVNLSFPFEYYFTPRYRGESRIAVDKSQIIINENFREQENFTIRSIKSKHPARDIQFEFMKDFSATMFFRDNTFEIVKLKAYVLDGALYGRDILFNLADMKDDNMEFRLILDVTNIDIAKLDEPDPAKKTREAELSLNANFSGRGVNIKKELSVKGYINIYKIGEEFANRLMKGLSEEKGESKLGMVQPIVDNFMIPKGFNFNLDKGLVYTTVSFERKTVSYVTGVKVENNQIKFERMPIQEYLRKVTRGE